MQTVSFNDVITYHPMTQDQDQSQSPTRWGMLYQYLPRCQKCGRFLSPKNPVCKNLSCKLVGKSQVEPRPWPPQGVRFTADASKVGQAVGSQDEQDSAGDETIAILESLSEKIKAAARHWAARTGVDSQELVQEMTLVILEKAQQAPDFLKQKSCYIISFATWRTLDKVRHLWNDLIASEFDPELEGSKSSPAEQSVLEDLSNLLDDQGRQIVRAILLERQGVIKRNGKLNVSGLARHLGMSKSTARRRVSVLRDALVEAGYTFT
jgi:DNA-binding transcriptional ArsR family regulator